MTTYDYMYNVLKLRGTINIDFQQLARLKDEGILFAGGYRSYERPGLTLICEEAQKLEEEIVRIVLNGNKDIKQIMYATDICIWEYLVRNHGIDSRDNGIHFDNLTIYYKGEE